MKSNPPVPAARRVAVARWCEAGLEFCLLLLPAMLALIPHGAAPLAGIAGLCALGLLFADPSDRLRAHAAPAAILAGLLLWAAVSILWAIEPARSAVLWLRLLGLAAIGLALAGAVERITSPRRLAGFAIAGSAIGIAVAFADLLSAGALSALVSVRGFSGARLNQVAVWLALLGLPVGAMLICRGRTVAGIIAGGTMAATVYLLDGTTAKIAVTLALAVAPLCWCQRRSVARIAAALSVLAILTAPVTLPRLAHAPALFARVDAFKDSAGHRLLIWSFTGDRIAERPFLGWGLDAARAIPGGKDEIRPGQVWLSLHPHDAALQVWLDLGAPGAALLALFIGLLWLRLAEAPWPRLYAAAAGGSLAATLAVGLAGWGVWEEWWLGTLGMAAFAVRVMARAAEPSV